MGLTRIPEDHDLVATYGKGLITEPIEYDEVAQSQIIRFDFILRKIIQICGKDSTENYNETTIDKIWFFALDSILKIKQEQITMLEGLREKKVDSKGET